MESDGLAGPRRPLADGLAGAREKFDRFLATLDPLARTVVFCHSDADGLAAGALIGRGLLRLGFRDVMVTHSMRGESPFADGARERIAALHPQALIVADLGVRAGGVLMGTPTLYVDHHRPEGEPADAVVISGYSWDPIPCSAWMAYDLLAPHVQMEDLLWIAAIGTLGDLGDAAPWPPLPAAKKRYTAKWLKEAVSLVNAARRAAAFDVETPLRMLMEADHPRAISDDIARGADRLHAYRAEVKTELQKARRAAPLFARSGPFALIRFHSPCQIHPLIAQQWRGRLKDVGVIAANSGFMPGQVAFSMRTARSDLNLLDALRAVDLGEFNQSFGFGHDQATGGHLPPTVFNQLMTALGFDAQAHV